jgi:hypothetical protein
MGIHLVGCIALKIVFGPTSNFRNTGIRLAAEALRVIELPRANRRPGTSAGPRAAKEKPQAGVSYSPTIHKTTHRRAGYANVVQEEVHSTDYRGLEKMTQPNR